MYPIICFGDYMKYEPNPRDFSVSQTWDIESTNRGFSKPPLVMKDIIMDNHIVAMVRETDVLLGIYCILLYS